jgi:hypothetical protein
MRKWKAGTKYENISRLVPACLIASNIWLTQYKAAAPVQIIRYYKQ